MKLACSVTSVRVQILPRQFSVLRQVAQQQLALPASHWHGLAPDPDALGPGGDLQRVAAPATGLVTGLLCNGCFVPAGSPYPDRSQAIPAS